MAERVSVNPHWCKSCFSFQRVGTYDPGYQPLAHPVRPLRPKPLRHLPSTWTRPPARPSPPAAATLGRRWRGWSQPTTSWGAEGGGIGTAALRQERSFIDNLQRNIFGLATKEASQPSMIETSRATASAVPPTADIVGHRGHVRKVPED